MGTPLKNPPVYLTLAQVRFNHVLKLGEFISKIQEDFRQAKYPDFGRSPSVAIQVNTQEGQQVPTLVQVEQFLFGDIDKTHVFVLDHQSLTLQSTRYGHYEAFSTCFQVGLSIVHAALNLHYTERIGLRYLDRVMPQEGDTVQVYLAPQTHGLQAPQNGKKIYAYTETMSEVGEIKLRNRLTIYNGSFAFPPDVQITNMNISDRFTAYQGENAILDNDGFIETREAFDCAEITRHLRAIHTVIGAAFKSAVTPYALTAWEK